MHREMKSPHFPTKKPSPHLLSFALLNKLKKNTSKK